MGKSNTASNKSVTWLFQSVAAFDKRCPCFVSQSGHIEGISILLLPTTTVFSWPVEDGWPSLAY